MGDNPFKKKEIVYVLMLEHENTLYQHIVGVFPSLEVAEEIKHELTDYNLRVHHVLLSSNSNKNEIENNQTVFVRIIDTEDTTYPTLVATDSMELGTNDIQVCFYNPDENSVIEHAKGVLEEANKKDCVSDMQSQELNDDNVIAQWILTHF